MASVNELYEYLNNRISPELSYDWDNDGRMCISMPDKEVKKVLLSLDISEEAIDYAAENGYDCILSHHPLIFDPIKNVDANTPIGRKLCKLIKNDISALSFHTRLDRWESGVNNTFVIGLLADCATEYSEVKSEAFSDIGRVFSVKETPLEAFALRVKKYLDAPTVTCVDGGKPVKKVAVVCGSGKGYIQEAFDCGCDTFITGEVPLNCEHEAKELGINLICAGHHFTERVVFDRLVLEIVAFDEEIEIHYFDSNPSFVV